MKHALPWLALLLASTACTVRVPDHGTYVGNPGTARVRAAPATGLDVTAVELPTGTLVPTDCEGADGEPTLLDGIDLDTPIELPSGEWCGLTLSLSHDTLVYADGTDGGTLELPLDVPVLALASAGPVDLRGSAWVLELAEPGWISAADLGVRDGEDVVLDPHGPPAEAAVVEVEERSGLFADPDLDGGVGESERATGAAMTPGG